MLNIVEHSSPQYPPRTYQNARLADLTVAIALDFNSAGERLTHRAAGERYAWIALSSDPHQAAEKLLSALREFSVRTLNVAGNGIYSLAPKGWPQERVNAFVFEILQKATAQWPIAKVISGGQTGIDLAGVTAAHALGIPAEATLPKGFVQRGLDNQDRTHTADEIRAQIESGAALLRGGHVAPPASRARKPRLFNIKRDIVPADAVYIGRGKYRGKKSKLGNIYVIGPDGDRNEVCNKFEEWAPTQPDVMAEIESLRGQDLACHCTPYRCHGDWILKMANRELEPIAAAAPATPPTDSSIQFDPQI